MGVDDRPGLRESFDDCKCRKSTRLAVPNSSVRGQVAQANALQWFALGRGREEDYL
jgi:hypothetical protein